MNPTLLHLLAHLGTAALSIVALTAAGIIFITNVIRVDYETAGRRSFIGSILLTALLLLPTYLTGDPAAAMQVDGMVCLGAVAIFAAVWVYVSNRRNKD